MVWIFPSITAHQVEVVFRKWLLFSLGLREPASLMSFACSLPSYEHLVSCILVCGSSGVAALNVGGRTIHSLLSLSLDLEWQIKEGTTLWWMIRTADMNIVDEFPLLSNKLLHTLHDVLHKVRRDKRNPFGGITVLLVGDPLQLPAVDLDIFDGALFRNHFVPFVLTDVMRQDNAHFINLPNRVRIGEESDEDHLILQQRIAPNSDV